MKPGAAPPPGRRAAVRAARAGDLEHVAALWTALQRHHARLDARFALRSDAAGHVREILRAVLRDPDAAAWLADGGGGEPPAGLCIARLDHAPPVLAEERRVEITDLFVQEAARRQGLGRALVRAARAFAAERGARRIEVRVAHANPEGQAFWRAQGFGDFVDVLDVRL